MKSLFQKPVALVIAGFVLGTASGYLLRGDDPPSQMARAGIDADEAAFNNAAQTQDPAGQHQAAKTVGDTASSGKPAAEKGSAVSGDKTDKLAEDTQHLLDNPPSHVNDPNFFGLPPKDPEQDKLRQEAAADYVRSLQEAGAPEDVIKQALAEYDVAMSGDDSQPQAEAESYQPTSEEETSSLVESLKQSGMSEEEANAQVENFRNMSRAEPKTFGTAADESGGGGGFGADGDTSHLHPEELDKETGQPPQQ